MDAISSFFVDEYHTDVPLLDSTDLRNDLWLEDLSLMELGSHLEARIAGCHIKTGEWDTIRTIGDLRKRCGQVADGRLRWAIDVGAWNPQAEEWDATLLLADPERREKVARYRFVEDQRRHLVGRLALYKIVHEQCGIPFKDILFAFTKGNKPVLGVPVPASCSFKNFNFNYSHEGDFVVVGAEPCSIVGVDVGFVTLKGSKTVAEHVQTFRNNFSPSEWAQMQGPHLTDHERLQRFFVFWTLKESYVKATGWGLATEFNTFEFRNVLGTDIGVTLDNIHQNRKITVALKGVVQSDWHFRVCLLNPTHIMSVATGPPKDAAPTFKTSFVRLGDPADPDWNRNPVPPASCETVKIMSVAELLQGIPKWQMK